jgi:hypothetical protein
MITLWFESVDQEEWTETVDTIEQAMSIIQWYMGTPEVGATYAVSGDGIVTCYVEGTTWEELGYGY